MMRDSLLSARGPDLPDSIAKFVERECVRRQEREEDAMADYHAIKTGIPRPEFSSPWDVRKRCPGCKAVCHFQDLDNERNLCDKCRKDLHAEDFYPCPCCRRRQDGQMTCDMCETAIMNSLGGKTDGCVTEEGWDTFVKAREWVEDYGPSHTQAGDYIRRDAFADYPPKKDAYPGSGLDFYNSDYWPGFYMGNGKWEKLDYLPELDDRGVVIPKPPVQ